MVGGNEISLAHHIMFTGLFFLTQTMYMTPNAVYTEVSTPIKSSINPPTVTIVIILLLLEASSSNLSSLTAGKGNKTINQAEWQKFKAL